MLYEEKSNLFCAVSSSSQFPADWLRTGPAGPAAAPQTASSRQKTYKVSTTLHTFMIRASNVPNTIQTSLPFVPRKRQEVLSENSIKIILNVIFHMQASFNPI